MTNSAFLPYGRQWIDEQDIEAVVEVLRSDWLTTGPKVDEFEAAIAAFSGARHGIAVSNGTAAMHAAMFAAEIGPGDEVIVPAMTFAASANAVAYQGGTPRFADVDAHTLLVDPDSVSSLISPRTRAVVAVDYAGQPCDYVRLRELAHKHRLFLIADACHSLGAADGDRPVGSLADLTAFSFHPVKSMTTAEGGMLVTDDDQLAERLRLFRNHGITTDHRQRRQHGTWYYEMKELGYNYRLSDLQCALGLSQLRRLPEWTVRRRRIAARYNALLRGQNAIEPLRRRAGVQHAYHLYVVRVNADAAGASRDLVFDHLRQAGIGASVHYIPVHLHPYYRRTFGTGRGLCPVAERAYELILSLPVYPRMDDGDVDRVVAELPIPLRGETAA